MKVFASGGIMTKMSIYNDYVNIIIYDETTLKPYVSRVRRGL